MRRLPSTLWWTPRPRIVLPKKTPLDARAGRRFEATVAAFHSSVPGRQWKREFAAIESKLAPAKSIGSNTFAWTVAGANRWIRLDAADSEFSFRSRRVISGASTVQLQRSRNHRVPTPTSRWRAPT